MGDPARKTCPACGTTNTRVFHWDEETIYCECLKPGCRMSGPLGEDVEEATRKWNALPRAAAA